MVLEPTLRQNLHRQVGTRAVESSPPDQMNYFMSKKSGKYWSVVQHTSSRQMTSGSCLWISCMQCPLFKEARTVMSQPGLAKAPCGTMPALILVSPQSPHWCQASEIFFLMQGRIKLLSVSQSLSMLVQPAGNLNFFFEPDSKSSRASRYVISEWPVKGCSTGELWTQPEPPPLRSRNLCLKPIPSPFLRSGNLCIS